MIAEYLVQPVACVAAHLMGFDDHVVVARLVVERQPSPQRRHLRGRDPGQVDRAGQTHVGVVDMDAADVPRGLQRIERSTRSPLVAAGRGAGDLRELISRQHRTGGHERAPLVERVIRGGRPAKPAVGTDEVTFTGETDGAGAVARKYAPRWCGTPCADTSHSEALYPASLSAATWAAYFGLMMFGA